MTTLRELVVFIILLWSASVASALSIVGPTQVKPYEGIELYPDTDVAGAATIWDVDREDIAWVREYGPKLVFVGPPGTYKVKLRVIRIGPDGKTINVETARTTVTIGPVGPIPPNPPDPVPPVDPLVQSLQDAFTKDSGVVADKVTWKTGLSSTYKQGAAFVTDPTVLTVGDLYNKLKGVVTIPSDALTNTRQRVAQELVTLLGTDPTKTLTADLRSVANKKFIQLADGLDKVK